MSVADVINGLAATPAPRAPSKCTPFSACCGLFFLRNIDTLSAISRK